jgi:hypothetical protein
MLRDDIYLCIINIFGVNIKSATADFPPHPCGKKKSIHFFTFTPCRKKKSTDFFLPHRAEEKLQPKF